MTDQRDRGYVLTEVLVAGAIAAAVTVTAMAGVSQSLRAGRQSAQLQSALIEAQNIADRLRAGVDLSSTVQLYPEWRIEIRPVDRPVDPATGAVLTSARITHPDHPQIDLQLVYIEAGQLLVE